MNKKRILRYIYYFPSTFINKIFYFCQNISVGKCHETKGLLYVRNKGECSIGDYVRINSSATANPIGCGERTYVVVRKNGRVTIGNHTRMSNCAISCSNTIEIGNYVRIGAGVKIFDTNFHSIEPLKRTAEPEEGPVITKPVKICDYSFVGAGAYVLKGVTVGEGSVIGAGSVVAKDVPPYEIWAGNPARKIGDVPRP